MECLNGHTLTLQRYYRHNCDVCKTQSISEICSMGCRTCNYTVCNNCFPLMSAMFCSSKHMLKIHSYKSHNCDVCRRRKIDNEQQTMGCSDCNYTVCNICCPTPVDKNERKSHYENELKLLEEINKLFQSEIDLQQSQLNNSAQKTVNNSQPR